LPNLKSLDLEGAINDDGVSHLKELTALRILVLKSANVTDTGLVHLMGLTELKRLNLIGTAVTSAGVANLQNALPKCQIYLNQ
jgi:hypothetical protein